MLTIYKDINDDVLHKNQLRNKDYYYKEYYENDILTKVETYSDHVLIFVKYMENTAKTNEAIAATYPRSVSVSFFEEVLQTSFYRELLTKNYKSGILSSQSLLIENKNGDIILDKTIKYSNDIILNFEKYYYHDEKLIYIFEYYDNGAVYIITSFSGNSPNEIRRDSDDFENFNWDGLAYYQDGNIKFP